LPSDNALDRMPYNQAEERTDNLNSSLDTKFKAKEQVRIRYDKRFTNFKQDVHA